jgi:sugar lactone lactonase YvrE
VKQILRLTPLIVIALVFAAAVRPQPARSQVNPPLDRNLLIADRGNNRIIEVTPDKQIVWEFQFPSRLPSHGADDAFFSPDHKEIVFSLGLDNQIQVLDYETKKITWTYGRGFPSAEAGHTYTPDDAYRLPDGNISVAEINNCRIAVYAPDMTLVREIGHANECASKPGYLNKPNGATPLAGGGFLITEITGARISEVDKDGKELWAINSGLGYPSDAQPTPRGTFIVADYMKYGMIVEMDHQGKILWQYGPYDDSNQDKRLRWPSIAAELPTGYVIATDDYNHRVIIIDKDTKDIVWQYGVTSRKGDLPGYLNIPDGIDWRK